LKTQIILVAVSLTLGACAGGGGTVNTISSVAQVPPTNTTPPAVTVEADNRIKFEPVTFKETLTKYGDTETTYSVSAFQPSTNFERTEKYKIADYGFFTATVKGRHTGAFEDPNEPIRAGTWEPSYQIYETDINGDGHKDFFAVEYIQGARDDAPKSRLLPFVNDGKGHFKLSPETFADKQFGCIASGNQLGSANVNNECGYYKSLIRHPVVADLDGDNRADFFWPTLLYLSKGGALQNASNTLPDFFKQPHIGPVFVHDLASGDVDGNKSIDIFVPLFGATKTGYLLSGAKDPCSTCNQTLPWVMLMNDGKGNFTMNTNFPTRPILESNQSINMWASTATIADFDGDGKGDVAVGWADPKHAEHFGYVKNSAGMVYYNDGKNDWRVRKPVELPANWYGANGRANDIVAIDYDGDGKPDIALASTRSDPYYVGRMVQIFKNVNGTSFVDVTKDVNNNTKYELGNGTAWWNGEGLLTVVDFNKDGKPDIVDSTYNTYVLINEGGKFKLVDNFPKVGGGKDGAARGALYPVEIDGKWDYDFISYRFDETYDTGTATMYQVLDPPVGTAPSLSDMMLDDFLRKPTQYTTAAAIANRGYTDLFYYSRWNSNNARVFSTYNNGMQTYGGTFAGDGVGLTLLNAKSSFAKNGNMFIADTDAVGVYANRGKFFAMTAYSNTRLKTSIASDFFGTAQASTSADTFGAELSYKDRTGPLSYSIGSRYNSTMVKGFVEQGADVNLRIADQHYSTANMVATVDYTNSFNYKGIKFFYGADWEYLRYFYTNGDQVQASTGGSFTTVNGVDHLKRTGSTVSLNAGAWFNPKANMLISVSNATKDPSYTIAFGYRF
jgi:hypothetical protein